jgi:hypothetical protein
MLSVSSFVTYIYHAQISKQSCELPTTTPQSPICREQNLFSAACTRHQQDCIMMQGSGGEAQIEHRAMAVTSKASPILCSLCLYEG